MENPKSNLLMLSIPYYRMQTQMFDNAIAGITEEDATRRIEDRTNHIVWMVGNMVNCRYWLANVLGISDQDPNEHLFKDARALDTNAKYPSLEALRAEWHKISPKLFDKLLTLDDTQLLEPFEFGMQVDFVEENKLNMVGMCLDRVSYLTGQVGLMRKALGLESMKYDMNSDIKY